MKLSLRAGVLLAAASLAVHELRYAASFGDPGATQEAGHGYLAWLAPLVALALATVCGAWLARIGRRTPTGRGLTWTATSTSLGAVYVVQETVEGLTTTGHPGLLAHSGWVALPIVLAVAGLVTLLMRCADVADRASAAAARPWSPRTATPHAPLATRLPSAAPLAPRPRGLARRIAGRAPPVAS